MMQTGNTPHTQSFSKSAGAVLLLAVQCCAATWAFAAPGDIDASFGTSGFARLTVPIAAPAVSVQSQPDGKLLVAGGDKIARFLANGQPDSAFGSAGVVTSQGLQSSPNHRVLVALPRTEGQLWALSAAQSPCGGSAGLCSVAGIFQSDDLVRIQLTSAGQPDGSTGLRPGETFAGRAGRPSRELRLAPDGAVLLTTLMGDQTTVKAEVHRFLPDRSSTQIINYAELSPAAQSCLGDVRLVSTILSLRIALDATGRLLLATTHLQNASGLRHLCLVRLNADGTLDTQWGTGGVREIADSSALQLSQAFPHMLMVRADQSLRLMLTENSNGLAMRPRWLHLRADGTIDTTRGGGSGVDSPVATPLEVIQDVALLPDGRMFMVGFRHDAAANRAITESPLIVSYGVDGVTPDFFNLGSGTTFRTLANATGRLEPQKLSVMSNGTVYLAGSFVPAGGATTAGEFAVVRIEPNRPTTSTPIDSGGLGGGGGGGGGCGIIEDPTRVDPTLALLMLLSLMALLARSNHPTEMVRTRLQ